MIGLAYDRRQAARIYHDVLVDVEGLGAYVTMYNGIRGPAGTYYDVASREARNNLRGLSVDLAVFDEVATHATTDVFDALLPTMATRPTALACRTLHRRERAQCAAPGLVRHGRPGGGRRNPDPGLRDALVGGARGGRAPTIPLPSLRPTRRCVSYCSRARWHTSGPAWGTGPGPASA